jgi:hypothetical protein
MKHVPPVDSRGHGRTPAVQLILDERDKLLIEAARRFCGAMSGRAAAKYLHDALSRYSEGRFRRSRFETTCPPAHRGRLDEICWLLLKTTSGRVPSIPTIRRVLGVVVSHEV